MTRLPTEWNGIPGCGVTGFIGMQMVPAVVCGQYPGRMAGVAHNLIEVDDTFSRLEELGVPPASILRSAGLPQSVLIGEALCPFGAP
jgi:hypothetical protein